MAIAPKLVILAIVSLGRCASSESLLARQRGCREDPNADVVPAKLADSEIVEGNDCGNVKVVVPKWQKSSKVGKIAGAATNAQAGAERAAAAATAAQEKAMGAADAANAVGGAAAIGAAEDATAAADKAGDASTKAMEASEALSNELDSMKGGIDEKPYEVDDSALAAVKKKSEEAHQATKAAMKAAEVALKEAKDAQTEALNSAEAALKMITELSDKSDKALELSSETRQEAQWAVNEATKTLEAADEVVGELNSKIDENEGDQAPVFEGIKEGLQAATESCETAKEALKSSLPDLAEKVTAAEEAAQPITDMKEDMAGGAGEIENAGEMADQMSTLDTKLKELDAMTTQVSMGTEDLIKKKKRVAKMAQKAAEFGIPWAPPPETPFGAPGEGRVGDNFLSVGAW